MGEQKFCCHLPMDSCQTHLSPRSLRVAYHISLETLRLGRMASHFTQLRKMLHNLTPYPCTCLALLFKTSSSSCLQQDLRKAVAARSFERNLKPGLFFLKNPYPREKSFNPTSYPTDFSQAFKCPKLSCQSLIWTN